MLLINVKYGGGIVYVNKITIFVLGKGSNKCLTDI